MCTVVVLMLDGSLVVVEKNSNSFFFTTATPSVVCQSGTQEASVAASIEYGK